jgi:CheY-like chemotaxis protein
MHAETRNWHPADIIVPRQHVPFRHRVPAALSEDRMSTAFPARILVVDDDAEMRAYIRRCLAPVTSHVLEAADGGAALEILRAPTGPPVTLVIADVVMPGMDGYSLREAVQASETLRDTPVLLVTGEATAGRSGQGPVLVKPFNGRLLRTYVREMLAACDETRSGP